MSELMEIKQNIVNFIGKYEVYIKPVFKLILALITFLTINGKLGYMSKINNFSVVLIAALMCSFMPMNFVVFLAAVFVVLHLYVLSLECAAVVMVLFLILFLLYFRLAPKDTITVVLTPILQMMGIPYVMPVAMGLVGGPASAASVGCGVVTGCVLKKVVENADTLKAMDSADMASRFRFIIDAILGSKDLILLVIAFAITIFVIYFVRQLPIDYSYFIAMGAGAIIDAIIVLVGNIALETSLSVGGILLGTILSLIVGYIIIFFTHNVDYAKTQKVQFQDDEYFYYVRAVPKRQGVSAKRKGKKRPVR